MENLKKLSIKDKQDIAISNDSENLKRLCFEILAAPILNVYRPKIYEMAEFITNKLIFEEEKKEKKYYSRLSKLTSCCKQYEIYCQCNAD
jgi:hypothetical protein